jgi:hypothetical protein
MAAADTHETIKELLEAVFSLRSVPRLYDEEQLPLPVSQETLCRQSVAEVGS